MILKTIGSSAMVSSLASVITLPPILEWKQKPTIPIT